MTHESSGTRRRGVRAAGIVVMIAANVSMMAHADDTAISRQASGSVGQPSTLQPAQEELDRSDVDARQWVTYNKGYLGYRFSKLAQITAKNARDLRVVCSFKLGETGSFHNGPIVYNGVMYITSASGTYAVDAATCQKRWDYHHDSGKTATANSKGAAVAAGRVIRGTPDGHLIALDANSGALLWDRQIMNSASGEYVTAAPLVWNGLVFIGKAGGDLGIRGEMMALKATDGSKVWSFNTVPSPGESGSETWENPASIAHGGGGVWTSFSLDTANNLLLIPVGNPGPDFANEVRPGTNLFTNCLVALDAKTGKLKWWYQLVAPDDRDWDTAVVASFDAAGGAKLAAAAGKDGVLHVVDRTSGKLRFKAPLVERYSGTSGVVPAGSGIRVCPIAAVQWNGPSYNPDTNFIYMNGIDWCAQGIKGPLPEYQRGKEYLGWANYYGDRDPMTQAFGVINAIDAATGETKWRLKTPAPPLGAITSTAGGLVITGETSGDLDVVDAQTGVLLLRTNIGGPIGGGVITYEVGGKQFIAAAAGNNSPVYQTKGDNRVVILGL